MNDLINLFTSTDESRPLMHNPVLDGDNVIATNGKMLVVCPKRYFSSLPYEEITEKYPTYKAIIPLHDKKQPLFTTQYDFIYNTGKGLFHKEIWEKCSKCEGYGYLLTESGKRKICQECDGDGNSEYLDNLIPFPNVEEDKKGDKSFFFQVKDALFNCNFLFDMSKIGKLLNCNFDWVTLNPTKPAIIYIDDIMVLIASSSWSKEDDKEHKGDLTKVVVPTFSI